MPPRNSHSSGGASGGNATTLFHTADTGALMVTLVVTEITGGSSLAAPSHNMSSGRIAKLAANVGPLSIRFWQRRISRATSPPANENGRAKGRAIRRQNRPSNPNPNSPIPITKVVRVQTPMVRPLERSVSEFKNQEATNPVRNGTPRKRPQAYWISTWALKATSARPSTTASSIPSAAPRGVASVRGLPTTGLLISTPAALGANESHRNIPRLARGTKNKKIQTEDLPASRNRRNVRAIPTQKNGIAIAQSVPNNCGRRIPRAKKDVSRAGRK